MSIVADHELQSLGAEMRALAARIDAPQDRLPFLGQAPDDHAWLEVHGEPGAFTYHLLYTERDEQSVVAVSTDCDEILFLVFGSVTQGMAMHMDAETHSGEASDRERWFAFQADLMERMRTEWGERERARHRGLLGPVTFMGWLKAMLGMKAA